MSAPRVSVCGDDISRTKRPDYWTGGVHSILITWPHWPHCILFTGTVAFCSCSTGRRSGTLHCRHDDSTTITRSSEGCGAVACCCACANRFPGPSVHARECSPPVPSRGCGGATALACTGAAVGLGQIASSGAVMTCGRLRLGAPPVTAAGSGSASPFACWVLGSGSGSGSG